ncbi:hypothetical protein [Paenibacillus daejeonensis]|uniref:hypothetical protein n=1 Tax=Paenibacillus daejeonensis TaxID=135193 RepID=UPI0012F7E12C|nr:hypothetical protein [Paenibacillus daejeonensis]
MIYWQIVPLFKTISGITNRYFIEHEEHGKLYIVKPANKEQVILYREMDEENVKGMYVFETKERLLSKKIYLEVEKESLIDTIKKLKNSRV